MNTSDPFNLQRFLQAQEKAYHTALEELKRGHKTSHWMWFIFPQLKGLGHSSMAAHYGIGSLQEAEAYLSHPVLGARLHECCQALVDQPSRDALQILGTPDNLKLRSSMTLFAEASPATAIFKLVLVEFFNGEKDSVTIRLLEKLK